MLTQPNLTFRKAPSSKSNLDRLTWNFFWWPLRSKRKAPEFSGAFLKKTKWPKISDEKQLAIGQILTHWAEIFFGDLWGQNEVLLNFLEHSSKKPIWPKISDFGLIFSAILFFWGTLQKVQEHSILTSEVTKKNFSPIGQDLTDCQLLSHLILHW